MYNCLPVEPLTQLDLLTVSGSLNTERLCRKVVNFSQPLKQGKHLMNTQNQSVKAILASNQSQVSKTYLLADSHTVEGNTFNFTGLAPVTLSDNILKALFIQKFVAEYKNSSNKQAILYAYEKDYLNTLHEKSAESATTNPLANVAKVLTAQEYLENCYKSGLDRDNIGLLLSAMSEADKLTTASTKAELQAVISRFQAIFITGEQSESYEIINKNEVADLKKWESLKGAGFSKIERRGVNLNAIITLSDAPEGLKVLQSIGYNFTDSKVSEDLTTLDVFFNEDEPATI